MILKQLIAIIRGNINIPLYPGSSDNIEECIIYNFTPLTNNKIMRQDSFKLRVKAFSYFKALETSEQLKKLLITRSDNKLTDDILTVRQNGGGEMFNEETGLHTITIIFDINSKVR